MHTVRRFSSFLLISGLLASSCAAHAQERDKAVLAWRGEQPVRAKHGMVVSVHHLASDAGLNILREGGNAVDSAVATAFALAVVHPIAGNLGGGGFLLLRTHDGKSTFIEFREKAPLAATETMYQDAKGNIIPDASTLGYRSIATPGSVAGLAYAERTYGKLGLKRVIAPAIKLASDGFALTAEEANELTESDLARFPESRSLFQRDGKFYRAGEVFKQPQLARTLERIAADPDDFYHGKMAQELVADLSKGGSLITRDDLAQYSVVERKPIIGEYRDYTIISAPPPSSGGIVLVSALNILERFDLAQMKDRSAPWIHFITEAFRRAYMDRAEYLGDPDFNRIPTAELISKDYAAAWSKSIEPDRASPSAALKRPAGFLPLAPSTAGTRQKESPDTTHLSVVDAEGNAVALTTTLNDSFGSHVTAGSLGFLLNDEMDDFTSKLGTPNMYGLIQGPANAIAPGKRPLSAMTPTIVLEDGKLRYVLGSPGGGRIITTVANIFLSATAGKLNIQEAVDAPRFHHQYLPDKLYLEPGVDSRVQDELRDMGHTLDLGDGHWSNGECIAIDPKTGELLAGHDHRSSYGSAAGY
ncbi:gamma-glutamyltransferase [Occallatibacter savannae]|uniref:gamma-glutamyltransferase n=1 Tax=Occallatibacter savannae TaxID=1002691 RepID=UPI000D6949AF|nr:gamma-glutamyltransferase [Occallatibacter savannae]